jgi:hypothetical protein
VLNVIDAIGFIVVVEDFDFEREINVHLGENIVKRTTQVNGHFLKLHFCMYVLPKFNNK